MVLILPEGTSCISSAISLFLSNVSRKSDADGYSDDSLANMGAERTRLPISDSNMTSIFFGRFASCERRLNGR